MSEQMHIYVDLDIVNNDQTTNENPPQLHFQETRNSPYIEGNSANYYCTILRFSIQTGNELPIFIPRVKLGQIDPNLTVYSVSMKNTYQTDLSGILKQTTTPLIYESWSNTSAPAPPLLSQDISSGYYFVDSYDQFTQMLNKALKTCFNTHFGVTSSTSPYAGREPYVQFDSEKNLFVLYGEQFLHDPQRLDSSGNPMPHTDIYFNTRLFQLLSSFPSQFVGNPGDLNYRVVFNNTRNTNIVNKKSNIWRIHCYDTYLSRNINCSNVESSGQYCVLHKLNPYYSYKYRPAYSIW